MQSRKLTSGFNRRRFQKTEARQKAFRRRQFRDRIFHRVEGIIGGVTSWIKIPHIHLEIPSLQPLGLINTQTELYETGSPVIEEDYPRVIYNDEQEVPEELGVLLREITYTMAHGDAEGNRRFTQEAWEMGASIDLTLRADIKGIHQWTEVIMGGIERR